MYPFGSPLGPAPLLTCCCRRRCGPSCRCCQLPQRALLDKPHSCWPWIRTLFSPIIHPRTAAGVADLLQQAAADGGSGGAASAVTVVASPPSGPPAPTVSGSGTSPSPTAVTPVTSPTPGGSSSGGGGLNAGAILGGGFAPSPSPPPLMPPFPPGQVALDPSKVDNTMQARGACAQQLEISSVCCLCIPCCAASLVLAAAAQLACGWAFPGSPPARQGLPACSLGSRHQMPAVLRSVSAPFAPHWSRCFPLQCLRRPAVSACT